MYLPNGLLTSCFLKHDVEHNPHTIAPDPFASDDCLDVFSPVYEFLPLEPEELNTMNPSEDEPSSGLNGRLRPRKSAITSPLSIKQIEHKFDGKQAQEKQLKRSSTPSKVSPSKPEDLANNSNLLPTPQLLCPYCDKKFGSKQNVSKHIRRLHLSASKIDTSIVCLFCNHVEAEPSDIIRHMIDSHPNQYFACLDCHTRFPSTKELAEHKLNICEKQKIPYRSKLRGKTTKKNQKIIDSDEKDDYSGKSFSGHGFNGIVISCELKPAHIHDDADIEDNITTNLILPPSKNISPSAVLEKNAVIVLDDIQWNRRITSNFSFHNADADQILSRLGVVHRSPKTGEPTKKDWFRAIEDATQKFEKCFDTSFYSKVASNVQENLTKFLDGSFNFNPDPDSTIKTRKSKNSVVIHTAEGFPILLACEQFSRNTYEGYMPRSIAPRHKWKWDNLESEKPWNTDQIKRDTHANNCIITLVSSLDIWTQLRMRRKFEDKFNITPVEKKTEKQNVISRQLKEILESREIPATNSQIGKYTHIPITIEQDFPNLLGLMPSAPKFNVKPAILSGEWVRPRCYVCCACGAQSRDSRTLSVHVSSNHPNAQVQHYEIVGESLLKADILKHLYVPPNQNINRTRPPRGFRDCTKCMKSITIEDLHQHMLDCAGDTPAVRRKCRYRPFGVRRRRPRLPDNRIRKKMRNDIRTRPTRQKNRMRSKPKIRSEVGDAETIRKMIADLPAKRHRVLVNPLNSILRPRRKLDKQRALLMMKRHISEDSKSSKQKTSNNSLHFDYQQTSTNIDRYMSMPTRDDDDKPLKSRLKRVACKLTRQKECLNRKALLNKPKREIRPLIEKNENESHENEPDLSKTSPIKVQSDELSVDHNEKRINLNSDPQNIREHSSGRGDGNNSRRDDQRPGCSGENGNLRNAYAPAQNIPLKHSIARLTANSETHDKSVQFHHLFLVQQECNNTNEHVPSGQRMLFENEAVVTKLDKPPLHFNQNSSLESAHGHNADSIQEHNSEPTPGQILDCIQKNKLNKPRKGLNDCIAMLKNKLVDTDPIIPAHVSVQCGTDDPLSPDPVLMSASTLMKPRVDVVMKSPQVCPNTERQKKTSPKSIMRNEQLPKPSPLYRGQYFNHDMYGRVANERQITQWRPVNYDAIMPRFIDNRARKEMSRRRSTSQHDNIYFTPQLLSVTPPNDDLLLKLSSEPYNAYNLPLRKSPKYCPEQFTVDGNKNSGKFGRRRVLGKTPVETSNGSLQICSNIVNNHTETKVSQETSKKITRPRTSTPRKQVESVQKHLNVPKEVPKSTRDSNEKYRKKAIDCQPQRDYIVMNSGEKKSENYPQVVCGKRSSNITVENNLLPFKQAEPQLKADILSKMPVQVYPEHINENRGSIPLAHASTTVESILPVPLDLSNKALNVDPKYSSRHDSILLTNYDGCETLDLSNKRRTSMEHFNEDEVVDLRVKHNPQYPHSAAVKPSSATISQQNLTTATALNLVHQNKCVPTDLSFKRNDEDTSLCINLSQKINRNENQVQDLSKSKSNSTENSLLPDNEQPTDLSNKKSINIEHIVSEKECNKNNGNEETLTNANLTICNDIDERDQPSDLSVKGDVDSVKKQDTYVPTVLTADNHVMSEQTKTKLNENINSEHETHVTPETSISFTTSSPIPKPVYDPTLRIPQYKIRPTGGDDAFKESNVTVTTSLTSISTTVESYSSHQISNKSTHPSCRSHNSTIINNSMIASIEAQERITYSFTKSVLNTSVTGSLPVYPLLHRGITTPFTTFESTRPVYALPNSCITMAKIDITTNNLLSIPSTTIMSTNPVYTLAGTTIATSLNYVTLPNTGYSIPYPPPCATRLPKLDSQMMTQYTCPGTANTNNNTTQEGRTYDNVLIQDLNLNNERDNEIARKLIMLPKDILSTLRTIPSETRNPLLDALMIYLSASSGLPDLSTQSLFQNSGLSMLTMPIERSRESTVDASTDTVDIKPTYSLQTVQNENRMPCSLNSSGTSLNVSEQQADKLICNNQVIDLTYDEIVPKADIDNEIHEEPVILTDDIPIPIASTSKVPKTNNDKTASLRAVRIKAPSERQKSKIMTDPLENLPCPEISGVSNNDNYDNESFQSLDPDISLDIQMYEVSSTQSNKNKVFNNEISKTIISTNKAPVQPICDNVMKSMNDLIVEGCSKNIQPQLLKQNLVAISLPGNGVNFNDVKDPSIVAANLNLNNSEICKDTNSRLNERNVNGGAVSVPHIQEKPIENLNRLEEDDDSDDDISLAVIVKQKQQNQNNMSKRDIEINMFKNDSNINEKSKPTNRMFNQQIKQADDIVSPEILLITDTKETTLGRTEIKIDVAATSKINQNNSEPSVGITELQRLQGDSNTVKTKQLKKKGKKGRRDTSSIKGIKIQDKKEIIIVDETDINKETDKLFESVKNGKENTINVKKVDITTDEIIKNVCCKEIQENPDFSNKISTTNVKCINDVLDEPTNIDGAGINPTVVNVERSEEVKNLHNLIQDNKVLNDDESEKIATKEKGFMGNVSSESRRYENSNNMAIPNDVLNNFNEEDGALSLRRSRRGKSLIMEGNEQPLIYTDTLLEQKAPLTKKQLIFSKLLLDEENNLKNSVPIDNNLTLPDENKSCHSAKPETISSEEKNKTLKRKKSPLPKKKSKKKKLSESFQRIDSYDDVAKAIVEENTSSGNYGDSKLNTIASYGDPNPDLICDMENTSDADNICELASNIIEQSKEPGPGIIIKRKIVPSVSNYQEQDNNIHSSKPKKLKLINHNDILDTFHSDKTPSSKCNHNERHNLPQAARRARSKSVVVKSSRSMLYDPYDIDLEDMGDKTEPFRKQRLSLLRADNFMLSKEIDPQSCATNESVTNTISKVDINSANTEFAAGKDFKEIISDSDESSKSDVPLKKYVEEKERKQSLLSEPSNSKAIYNNTNDEDIVSHKVNVKQSRRKHKKNKQCLTAIDTTQKEDKDDKVLSEEQLRSEQFMESFGFFSERKPRKSNLLATKKISETFHIIANDSDDAYLDTRERPSKKGSQSDSDDAYLDSKERPSKKGSRSDNKKTDEEEYNDDYCNPEDSSKLSTKSDKSYRLRSATLYCHICKKEFRRVDNLVRHQMTLLHASKLSESAMKIRTAPVTEAYNYLLIFKQHIDRLRFLEHKMKNKKHPKAKFTFPTLQQVLVDVRKAVREQQLARRNLSRDQALFLDCCELLKDSNRSQGENRSATRPFFACCPSSHALARTSTKEYDPNSGLSLEFSSYSKCVPDTSNSAKKPIIHTSARLSGMANFVAFSSSSRQSCSADLYSQPSTSTTGFPPCTSSYTQVSKQRTFEEITNDKEDSKSEGDVDSITAQNILESEEVKNLEKDLISGLKEAACKFQPLPSGDIINSKSEQDNLTTKSYDDSICGPEIVIPVKKDTTPKVKNHPDNKEKKNLDIIENIDIFEDKFDKIKRKCRSQAAAAKQVQTTVEASASHKKRKKSDKKKGKKTSKKYNQNTVLTKGALKGYDSIKVSILTSEIDMSAIVPPIVGSSKKKKKRSSKKKRDRKKSILSRKLDSAGTKESSQKNIDVYEFLDNEEPEIFELRPSTVMERFRNLNKKDMQISTKIQSKREKEESSDSVSDEDDFVYMSDDYVCSDDETENSLMSCELGIVKGSNELKKSYATLKRKDVLEKNVVMGKIFKHNAVRAEKKTTKPKETLKPTANLDQLFDSLLEEEPNSSALMDDTDSPKEDCSNTQKKRVFSPIVLSKYDLKTNKSNDLPSKKSRSPSPALSSDSAVSRRVSSLSSRQSSPRRLSSSRYDVSSPFDCEASTSKRYDGANKCDTITKDHEHTLIKKYDISLSNKVKTDDDLILSSKRDKSPSNNTYDKSTKDGKHSRKKEKSAGNGSGYDFKSDYYDEDVLSDDAGVARQRARRKCTVGKQNILAETWSSESELDGVPPRPNSAESVVLNVARKRKGRKREGHVCGSRKSNKHVSVKKQDFESRVTSSNRNTGTSSGVPAASRSASGSSSSYTQHLSLPGPSGIGPRLRPTTSFWADGDEEPEHVQQHGWIVGDSHKKLVTMLAHAKGRKRNNDDKVRLME